jgi:hypothetical protein
MPIKKINKTIGAKEKQSRAKYQCPTNLKQLISDANYVLDRGELPEIQVFTDAIESEFTRGELDDVSDSEELFGLVAEDINYFLEEKFDRLGSQLFEEVFSKNNYLMSMETIDHFYINSYIETKRNIDNLIKFAQGLNELRKGIRAKHEVGHLSLLAMPAITHDNKIHWISNTNIRDITQGIEADRLRVCEVCNHIFWANNKNSETCSKPCLNILRQRKYLKANKTLVNRKRRESYYKKNRIPYCEKCIYPNTRCSCYINERSKNNGTI